MNDEKFLRGFENLEGTFLFLCRVLNVTYSTKRLLLNHKAAKT